MSREAIPIVRCGLLVLVLLAGACGEPEREKKARLWERLTSLPVEERLKVLREASIAGEPSREMVAASLRLARHDPDDRVRGVAARFCLKATDEERAEFLRERIPLEKNARILERLLWWAICCQGSFTSLGHASVFTPEDVPLLLEIYLVEPENGRRPEYRVSVKNHVRGLLVRLAPEDDILGSLHDKGFRKKLADLEAVAAAKGLPKPGELAEWWSRLISCGVYDGESVSDLEAVLTDPTADKKARATALCALGWQHTDDALAAIDRFRERIARARPFPETFRLEELDHPSTLHFAPWTPEILAQAKDDEGRTWGLIYSITLAGARLALTRRSESDGDLWEREIITDVKYLGRAEGCSLFLEGDTITVSLPDDAGRTAHRLSFDDLRADRDRDGVTDLVERLLGLDPAAADTDGDGDPDGLDPFPNAAPVPEDEEVEIRQAVWAAVLGTGRGPGQFVVMDPRVGPRHQYRGYGGPVVWSNPAATRLREEASAMILTSFEVTVTGDRARVLIADSEHCLAAASSSVCLRRFRGRWLVTGIIGEVIS